MRSEKAATSRDRQGAVGTGSQQPLPDGPGSSGFAQTGQGFVAGSVARLVYHWGEMIKFSHSVFALPFAVMAVFLACREGYRVGQLPHAYPSPLQLGLVVVCMVAARSVAMTFNRIVDADLDARNPRTAQRALVVGAISSRQAWLFLLVAAGIFILGCAGFWWGMGNPWPIGLSLPVLAYLCFYSYCKRFTRWSHFVLGSAIALSPPAAWVAVHPASLGWPALLLMAAVTFWIAGFDVIYACQDIASDRAEGLFSLPATWGAGPALWVARTAHFMTVALLAALGLVSGLGLWYWVGVLLVGLLLLVENLMVHRRNLSRVPVAFLHINGLVSLLMAALTVLQVLSDLP